MSEQATAMSISVAFRGIGRGTFSLGVLMHGGRLVVGREPFVRKVIPLDVAVGLGYAMGRLWFDGASAIHPLGPRRQGSAACPAAP
ncbi:MAG: hypothetical protein AB1451_06070 [Nitrospirota bacterium]